VTNAADALSAVARTERGRQERNLSAKSTS